jgi:CubicO group peptidase (beta-lactamase class C family)
MNRSLLAGPGRIDRYAGQGFNEHVTLENWQDAPFSRWGFSHVSELITTAPIHRAGAGEPPVRFPESTAGELDRCSDVDDFLRATHTDAFVVLHRGALVYERYFGTFGPQDRHILMSVSKSICALTVGVLAGRGLIDPRESVSHYVPLLKDSAYGDASVQQVLDMTAAVRYSEDYVDPASEVQQQDRVAGWRPRLEADPADTYEFLMLLRRAGEHGRSFQYCSAGTDVLAWIVENVTGARYADVVSRELWSRLGCGADALVTTDSGGFAFANGGIACTARDLARIGQLMLDDGEAGGKRVVPSAWIGDTMRGGDPLVARGSAYQKIHPNGSYRNQWWVPGDARGTVYAAGIHGQFVWVDPPTQTVIAKFSSCPDPVSLASSRAHTEGFRRVVDLLESA